MITESYCEEWASILTPEAFLGEKRDVCDTAIATFSNEIASFVLDIFPHNEIGHTGSANGLSHFYLLNVYGRHVVFYMSPIGSCQAGNALIEVLWQTGIKKLIIFGSAGALDSEVTNGKFVIPTEAYRDEGMSYHYAPASDFISINNCDTIAAVFDKLNYPYVKGRIWTTDAPYRETKTAVEKRKSEGCIAVDMEAAGIQAVCDFYGMDLYCFVVTGDILDKEKYMPEGLTDANHAVNKFFVALKILEALDKQEKAREESSREE